jgi:HTH-type transcriptional regulator / antitoxin HigA
MKPKIIKNEAEQAAALTRIEQLFGAKPGSPEGDELELLVHLVETYEASVCPIAPPSPLAALRFRMDQQHLKAKDLIPYLGSASKVSEVLSGRRRLSLTMIRKLVVGLGIPAEILLQTPRGRWTTPTGLRRRSRSSRARPPAGVLRRPGQTSDAS